VQREPPVETGKVRAIELTECWRSLIIQNLCWQVLEALNFNTNRRLSSTDDLPGSRKAFGLCDRDETAYEINIQILETHSTYSVP